MIEQSIHDLILGAILIIAPVCVALTAYQLVREAVDVVGED